RRSPRRRRARPYQASQTASPKTPTRGRRNAPWRAETAVPHFWLARQSGESKAWNASNPRFASAAEGALLARRREKWDSPEVSDRSSPIRRLGIGAGSRAAAARRSG